jgi:putative ABC transport system substrate-binding protein
LGFAALSLAGGGAWGQARPRLIAVLNGSAPDAIMQRELVGGLREGLAATGLVDGRDVEVQFRWAEGRLERLPALLDELLRLRPAVLVAAGARPTIVARDAKVALPVAALVDDPVQLGIAQTLARPGGWFTGVSAAFQGILARRMQVLVDLIPAPRRLAVLANPLTSDRADVRQALDRFEPTVGGPVRVVEASAPADFDAAFRMLANERINGLLVLADPTFYTNRHDLGARCTALKLPSVWGGRGYLEGGGVASFQGDFRALYVRMGILIDKILKGTPPGEIPFEQGTKFELVVSARAARELGLTIPQRVLVAADEVIE